MAVESVYTTLVLNDTDSRAILLSRVPSMWEIDTPFLKIDCVLKAPSRPNVPCFPILNFPIYFETVHYR